MNFEQGDSCDLNFISSIDYSNRKKNAGITIDTNYTKFFDDGIFLEKRGKNYFLQVSISDVSEFIKIFTENDFKALSIFNSNKIDYKSLFSSEIKEKYLSLSKGESRLTLTVELLIDKSFNCVSCEIYESIFYNKRSFSSDTFLSSMKNKNSIFYYDLNLMYFFSKELFKRRSEKYIFKQGKKEEVDSEGDFTIREIMILINREVAIYCFNNNFPAIYYNHLELDVDEKVYSLNNKTFYDISPLGYYFMGEEYYTHFTSPIRRYPDLILHRQIKAFLNKKKFPYSLDDIKRLTQSFNYNSLSIFEFSNIIKYIIENDLTIPEGLIENISLRISYDKINTEILFYLMFSLKFSEVSLDALNFLISTKTFLWPNKAIRFIKENSNFFIFSKIQKESLGYSFIIFFIDKTKEGDERKKCTVNLVDKKKTKEIILKKGNSQFFSKLLKYLKKNKIDILAKGILLSIHFLFCLFFIKKYKYI